MAHDVVLIGHAPDERSPLQGLVEDLRDQGCPVDLVDMEQGSADGSDWVDGAIQQVVDGSEIYVEAQLNTSAVADHRQECLALVAESDRESVASALADANLVLVVTLSGPVDLSMMDELLGVAHRRWGCEVFDEVGGWIPFD